MIVDLYISAEELAAYAMATENRSTKVVVLTGSEKSEEIRRYREQIAEGIDVYIMKDKPYPVHDRFLVVDNTVWFCGSSFHSIGGRMSCIVRLPDGDEIVQYMEGLLYTYAIYKLEAGERGGRIENSDD